MCTTCYKRRSAAAVNAPASNSTVVRSVAATEVDDEHDDDAPVKISPFNSHMV